jgi:hypothetical protein
MKKRLKLSFYNCQTDSTTYAYQFDSYIVDVHGKPLLFTVERQAEPSISPDNGAPVFIIIIEWYSFSVCLMTI